MLAEAKVLIFEGPAGVGKTTLTHAVAHELRSRGIQAGVIEEFSSSPLGQVLRTACAYGRETPEWLDGLAGLVSVIADKVHQVESVGVEPQTLWIADRFFTTQLVLGLSQIEAPPARHSGEEIVKQLETWAETVFSPDSLLIFLEAPLPVLINRLESRLKRPLRGQEMDDLQSEINGYQRLLERPTPWRTRQLDGTRPVSSLILEVLEWMMVQEKNS